MTPEQLKASILQYAIQGKLVEQRAEEGTAEDLLKSIEEKKQKLIKGKIIKKSKPLEPINESDVPFDLPQSWKWVKWGDIVNIVSARRVHQSDWKREGIPFYRAREIAEMSRTNGVVDNELFISEDLYNEFSAFGVPKPGDIMVTAVGTLGKTYIVKETDKFYYKDASVICFKNHYNMCSEYLAMMMQTPLMVQQIKNNSEGTTVATLTMVRMVEYLFPLPPLEEQYRIVAKIEELLPYVDRYAVAYKKLEKFNARFPEDMKKSILQYAIQGKLVEQRPEEGNAEELYQQIQEEKQKLIKEGKIKKEKPLAEITEDEIPFDIPESWKWVRLGNCIDLLSGQDLTSNRYNNTNNGIVYLTGASNIDNDGNIIINRWTTSPTSIAHRGNLLLTCKGTIGKTCILNIDEAHIARQIMAITAILIDINYLKYFIEISIKLLQAKAKSMIPGINRDTVNGLLVPLPPLEEQHRIVAKIEELLPYCDQLIK